MKSLAPLPLALAVSALAFCLIFGGGLLLLDVLIPSHAAHAAPPAPPGPTSSGPIAVTPDDRFVWVVNPDLDEAALIEVRNDANTVVARVPVGDEPHNIALSPDGRFAFVANTVSGTVSVIRAKGNPRVIQTIEVGTEPYGLAFTPNGDRLYVTNARSNDVTVIDPKRNVVLRTIDGVGLEPRGIAITSDGDGDDADEKVYVTQFFGVDRPGTIIGADDYKEGRVTVISTATDQVIGEVVLAPIADVGFLAAGDALARIPPGPDFIFPTGAFPNMLNSVVIKGDRAYLPNTAASANGPVRFNVNLQAFLSVIDTENDVESQARGERQTINMNRGINFEPAGENKIFLGVPWAVAFQHNADVGLVVAAAANIVVRVELDDNGTPTINAPLAPGDPGAIVRIKVGQNPRGIAINAADTRAYVANEVSRDVSVIDLATNQVIDAIQTGELPAAGSDEATLLLGKALFNSSTGVDLPELGPLGVMGTRLSSEGWSACFSCHPFGLTDGVVWIFGNGPRRTLPLNQTFNPNDPNDIKLLNHSAIRDEVQDFELNIRAVSGGLGLITLADGVTPDPNVTNLFGLPNTGRSERLDALTEYVARGIRSPISPASDEEAVAEGRTLFAAANCASCHGGEGWSVSRRNFTPPPDSSLVVAGQVIGALRQVGTFDPAALNEVRDNAAPALGADGFVPPSLLGDFALGPFFHNGSALTFDQVLENVAHRASGTGGVDVLSNPEDRSNVARFLESIDASTEPFPITSPGAPASFAAVGALLKAQAAGAETSEPSLTIDGPNPFWSRSSVSYSLPKAAEVDLAVFDVQGRRVATLVSSLQPAGGHAAAWDGQDLRGRRVASGTYFLRLSMEGTEPLTRRLTVMR